MSKLLIKKVKIMGQNEGGLDIKKLREVQKDINKKAGGGDGIMLFSNKIPEELNIRLLPPPAVLNGMYYVEQVCWWINGKLFISNSTEALGGGIDVIEEEIELAKKSKDKDVIALLEKKKDKMPVIKKEFRYLMGILTLKVVYDEDDNLISCTVDEPRVLVAKPTLLKAINTVVTSRPFQNGTKHGVADRVKGYNMIVSKEGKGIDTVYAAMGWNEQMELPAEYYEEKKIPNVYDMTVKDGKSDEHLRSIIRNYLYGDVVIEDSKGAKDGEEEEEDEAPVKKAAPMKKPSLSKAEKHTEESEEEEAPASKAAPKKPINSGKGRSLLDDVEQELGDLD